MKETETGNPLTTDKINLNQEMLERMYIYHAFRILDEESFATC